MRTNARLTVGSPSARVTAILSATLLLAVGVAAAGITGQRLLAADDPIVVAQDGSGDVATINEAVALAADGDTILVRPGTYRESVIIDKDISLVAETKDTVILEFAAGCGLNEEGYIECPDGTPLFQRDTIPGRPRIGVGGAYAIQIIDADAEVADLTIRDLGGGTAIVADGGAPIIRDVETTGGWTPGIQIFGSSAATVRDSEFGGSKVHDPAPVTFSGNVIRGGLEIDNHDPDHMTGPVIVRDNELGNVSFSGAVTVEGNVFFDELADEMPYAVSVLGGSGWTIRDNVIRGFETGIAAGAEGVVEDNVIEGNGVGFSWTGDLPAMSGNRICDNRFGNVRGYRSDDRPDPTTNEICPDE